MQENLHNKKFGLLKKANVLLEHERLNDAIQVIEEAVKLVKESKVKTKSEQEALEKKWQEILGL